MRRRLREAVLPSKRRMVSSRRAFLVVWGTVLGCSALMRPLAALVSNLVRASLRASLKCWGEVTLGPRASRLAEMDRWHSASTASAHLSSRTSTWSATARLRGAEDSNAWGMTAWETLRYRWDSDMRDGADTGIGSESCRRQVRNMENIMPPAVKPVGT